MILGIPWLKKYNPYIDWRRGVISWSNPEWKKKFRDIPQLEDLGEFNPQIYELNTKTSTLQRLAISKKQKKEKNPREIVPPEFHDYFALFNERESERYPPARV